MINYIKKWIQTAELEFIIPSEVEDSRDVKLDKKVSYGALYSINYPILNKLTFGAVTGVQHQIYPKITCLKLGGILRYYFVDYDNVNIYTLLTYNIGLQDYIKNGMGNLRLGLTFPIKKFDDFNLTLNVLWDYNYYNYKNTGKYIYYAQKDKGAFIYRAYGIGLGIQF